MPIFRVTVSGKATCNEGAKQKLPKIDGNRSLSLEGRQLVDVLPICINASKIFRSGTIPAFALARFQFSIFKHYYIHKIRLQEKKFMNNNYYYKNTVSKSIPTEN